MAREYQKQQDLIFQEIEEKRRIAAQRKDAEREEFVNSHSQRDIKRLAEALRLTPEQARQWWREAHESVQEHED